MPRTTAPIKNKKSENKKPENQNKENSYVPIPFWLLERRDLTHFQKLLLGVISNLCKNSEEGCYAKTITLSSMTGSSEKYIKNQLKILEEKGWIHRENLGDRRFIYPSLERKRKESIKNEESPIRVESPRRDRQESPIRDLRVPYKGPSRVPYKGPKGPPEGTLGDTLPIVLKENKKKKKYTKKSLDKFSKINTQEIDKNPRPKLKKKPKPIPKRKIKQDPYFINSLKEVLSSSNGRFINHPDFETKFISRWKEWIDYGKETHKKKFNDMIVQQLGKMISEYTLDEFIESTSLSMANGWKIIVWPDERFNKKQNHIKSKSKKNSSSCWEEVDHDAYDKV